MRSRQTIALSPCFFFPGSREYTGKRRSLVLSYPIVIMVIRIVKRKNPFVQIDNQILEDGRLSWKAKGLLAFLLSRPLSWRANSTELVEAGPDGREAVQAGFRELREAGYAWIESERGPRGKLVGRRWVVSEKPTKTPPPRNGFSDSRRTRPRYHHLSDDDHNTMWREGSLRSSPSPSTVSFFQEGEEINPVIKNLTDQLEEFVRRKRKLNGRRFNKKTWYLAMQKLLQDIEGDESRLTWVMHTYLTSPHTIYTPQAESATSFREKFLRIEKWAEAVNPSHHKAEIKAYRSQKEWEEESAQGKGIVGQDEIEDIPE